MKKFRLLIAFVCAILCLSVVGCSTDVVGKGYWELTAVTYEDGALRDNYVQLTLAPEDEYEIWAYVTALDSEDFVLSAAAGYSTTVNSKKNSVTVTKEMLAATGGWVRLLTEVSSSYTNIDVYSTAALRINEIVVCSSEEAERYELTFRLAGYRISQTNSSNRHVFTDEEYENMKNGPKNVCDDQSIEFARDAAAKALDDLAASSASDSATGSASDS